jgi:hypothetical protein
MVLREKIHTDFIKALSLPKQFQLRAITGFSGNHLRIM